MNHSDPLHTSRVTAPQTCPERKRAFDISKFLPISCNFKVRQLFVDVLDHQVSHMTFDQHTMNFRSLGLDFKNSSFDF